MENRKEQQLGLFADRTSAATMRANQLRLYFASFAYVLMHALRRLGAEGTELARAQCTTLRLKLLKVGVRVKITMRKVWLSYAQSYPYAETFAKVLENLQDFRPAKPSRELEVITHHTPFVPGTMFLSVRIGAFQRPLPNPLAESTALRGGPGGAGAPDNLRR